MDLHEAMNKIEGHRFSAEVNLAAGATAFRRILQEHESCRDLIETARTADAKEKIVRRVAELSEPQVDPRYENVYDAAISAYLAVLSETGTTEEIAEAGLAACKARNTWWTSALARELVLHAIAKGALITRPGASPITYSPEGIQRQRDTMHSSIAMCRIPAVSKSAADMWVAAAAQGRLSGAQKLAKQILGEKETRFVHRKKRSHASSRPQPSDRELVPA